MITISLFIIHSLSQWQLPLKGNYRMKKFIKKDVYSYKIDKIGFHEINDIQGGDSIKIKFNRKSLRLFAIFTKKQNIVLNNLYIDGSDILKNTDDTSERVAYAIDAKEEAIFKFESLKENNNQHNPHKNQKKIKFLMSKLNLLAKHDKYDDDNDDDDFTEFHANSISAKFWLLPRDFCGKSSVFEYGGTGSNLTVGLSNSMVTSQNKNEVKYTNCIFSPLFDKNNTYSLNISIKPLDDNNGFLSSQKAVFTDNVNEPEFISINDETANHSISKPFFVKYEITQKLGEGQYITPFKVNTEMKRKVTGDFEFEFDVVGFVCLSGVFECCDSTECFKDDFVEESLFIKCENEMLTALIHLLIAVGVIVFVILVFSLFCCGFCGCCSCCFCCALCCMGKECCCQKSNEGELGQGENEGMTSSIWRRGRQSQQNDIEIPLMSIDQNQNMQPNPYNEQMANQGQNVTQQSPQVSPYNQEQAEYL